MVTFQDLLNDIGDNLGSYARGTWSKYLTQANEDLSSLGDYSVQTNKDITLLKKDLPYIKQANNLVNGSLQDPNGQADFTFYQSVNSKPLLAKPNSDKKDDVKDNYTDPNIQGTSYKRDGQRREYFYAEDEGGKHGSVEYSAEFGDTAGTSLDEYDSIGLVGKTNKWMRHVMNGEKTEYIQNRFKTIISRFHTDADGEIDSVGNSASSKEYGLSHGRNLRKVTPTNENGYTNPYCRVWTWHHQYKNFINDTMRPFMSSSGTTLTQKELSDDYNWSSFRSLRTDDGDGGERLAKYGSMYDNGGNFNGLVNITPVWQEQAYDSESNVNIQHCMFSIENLAWKGVFNDYDYELSDYDEISAFRNGLSREQKGPLGGRIMWFPPYDLKFNEHTDIRWDENVFIGRGEPMYTYSNTSRGGQLSFKLLIDHPAVLDYWERRSETPSTPSDVDDIDSKEQELLRFFAGCAVLKASTPDWKIVQKEPQKEPEPEPVIKKVDKQIQFFVFFPNNYSGKDDGFEGTNVVNPIDYLVNGVGAQRKYNSSTKKGEDFGVDMTVNAKKDGSIVGGYEMRNDGISLVDTYTTTNAIISGIDIGGSTVTLMKMYDEKSKKGTLTTRPTDTKKGNAWDKGRYYYRADKNTLNQVLTGEGAISYIDRSSSQLNSTGYTKAVKHHNIQQSEITYSLTDMYVAINGDKNNVLSGLYTQAHVDVIKDILAGNKGKITKVICKGRASTQANGTNAQANQTSLAKYRASTIQKWLKKTLPSGVEYSEGDFKVSPEESPSTNDSNDSIAKLTRMTFVEIHYETEDKTEAANTQAQVDSDGTDGTLTDAEKEENKQVAARSNGFFKLGEDGELYADNSNLNEVTVTAKKRNKQLGRYDNEAQFFDKIGSEDPFMARLLSERIKFFNPAFHSMSPEGFNARLTFLNQCCRQGPTFSHSDTGANANNLAFGRPPICVLRVGDFYNTKIVITSLNIDYDPLTWDLNEEGIGVMPMIANVSISFNFIGGSELGGPVQRLQNALSYNYYANASVYDNRAEQINYGDFGEVDVFRPWQASGQIFNADTTNSKE